MWFKNVQLYKFTQSVTFSAEKLSELLADTEFHPCTSTQFETNGWVPPFAKDDDAPLAYSANGFIMICQKTENKILPNKVLMEHVQAKVDEIEANESRKVFRKEKMRIKEELIFSLLPQAFTQSNKMFAYIDPQDDLLVIDTPSRSKAEAFISQLRKSLGSLKVELIQTRSVEAVMTAWLQSHDLPQRFSLNDSCALHDPKNVYSVVRGKGQDLLTSQIQSFIDDGYSVFELGVQWYNQVGFTLTSDFSIKRLAFFDSVKEQVSDNFTETEADRFDADFVIMTATLRELFRDILVVLEDSSEEQTNQTHLTHETDTNKALESTEISS